MIEELAAVQEVHHKVEFRWSLKGVVKFNDKRAVNFFQNISFSYVD